MNNRGIIIGGFIVMFLFACAMMQQGWAGSAEIRLKDGRTAFCPDGVVTTPAVVACYTAQNGGKNIFSIVRSDITSIIIAQ